MHIICSSETKLGTVTIQIWAIIPPTGKRKMIGKSGNLEFGKDEQPEMFSEFEVEWDNRWDLSARCPALSLTKQVSLHSKTKSVLINVRDSIYGPQLEIQQNTKELVRG